MTPEEREQWRVEHPEWRPPAPGERHRTASALVLDVERRRVLLVAHKLTGRRQFSGGHLEGDEDGATAALREVLEETGVTVELVASEPSVPLLFGTWVPSPWVTAEFPAPADPGWGEPAHRHLDELYLAVADSEAPTTAEVEEVDGVYWTPVDQLGDPEVRADVAMLARLALRWFPEAGPPSVAASRGSVPVEYGWSDDTARLRSQRVDDPAEDVERVVRAAHFDWSTLSAGAKIEGDVSAFVAERVRGLIEVEWRTPLVETGALARATALALAAPNWHEAVEAEHHVGGLKIVRFSDGSKLVAEVLGRFAREV